MASSEPAEDQPALNGEDASNTAPKQPPVGNDQPTDAEARPLERKKVSYMSLNHKRQLAFLCLARIADPLAQTSIQSYMFYQLRSFNPTASTATISTQAGILIGAKTAAQVFTGILWGRLADSEYGGRKMVLFIGLTSSCIAYLGYGLSRNYTAAILWQVFGGALNNNVAITRCVVAELNPEKSHRARALLLLPLCATAGSLLGPLIGGLLSSSDRDTTSKYPYLGPNVLVAAIFLLAALGVLIGTEETLESLQGSEETPLSRLWKRLKKSFRIGTKGPDAHTEDSTEQSRPSESSTADETTPLITTENQPRKPLKKKTLPFSRIWTFNVVCTMLSHFIIVGHFGTFSSLWVIFLSTPIGDTRDQHPPLKFTGGIGMLPADVGYAMSILGAIGAILQLSIYPTLQDRFGPIRIWRTALLIFPICYLLAPFPSLAASSSASPHAHSSPDSLATLKTTTTPPVVWLAISPIILLFIIGRTGATPATTLIINDCTPHPSVRGTIHTMATVFGHLSRSIFPIATLWIYGLGLDVGVVGIAFWCLAGLAVLACIASFWVREGSNGKEIVLEDEEDEEEED